MREKLNLLDSIGKRYSVRPSTIRNGLFKDLQFDYLCYEEGVTRENIEMKKAMRKQKHGSR